jgi:SAM-dependent MidA family methyltransferase
MDEQDSAAGLVPDRLANLLKRGDLSFCEFVEWALYDETGGYYAGTACDRDRHRDFITAPAISPIFSWTIVQWFRKNFPSPEDIPSAIVDIGCGDGGLLAELAEHLDATPGGEQVALVGIDRALGFIPDERRRSTRFHFAATLDAIPTDRPVLVVCNELFDALPFARVVRRESGIREICVTLDGERLEWSERPAGAELVRYLERRGVELATGQFADFTPGWGELYEEIAGALSAGIILTLDYGYDTRRLFDNRVRRFGTAAAYAGHQVHRNLLAIPGQQDLTCHVNFDDLVEAGERKGFETVTFTRLARFLLEAGAASHPIFSEAVEGELDAALEQRQERENARRLLLPDGIGDEMRVLVQKKGEVLPVPGLDQI